ncbi:MAG: hypothetical protein FWF77_09230 [Defluviitaleaceae bacterium]|nr:hypothetical protein [Defluviitaleaceae bacterium]
MQGYRAHNILARQARSGHRGHVSAATRSLEAGSSFLFYTKARQARSGHRGYMPAATRSLEAGSSFPVLHKKPRGGAVFFYTLGNCFRLRENVPTSTHSPGAYCALGALVYYVNSYGVVSLMGVMLCVCA